MSHFTILKRHRRAVTAGAAVVMGMTLTQCDRPAPGSAPPAPTEAPDPVAVQASTASPKPATALTRNELVSAAGQAASAYAQGRTPEAPDPLVGRTFSVRIPFGCAGPSAPVDGAAGDGIARWTWGPDHQTIQLSLTPGDWTGSALTLQSGPADAAPAWEAVEGFWIPRPWLAAETCPGATGDPLQTGESIASPQTVGIAAVFEAGGSRIARRNGKAYVFTLRAKADAPVSAPADGYRLRLEGRVAGFPGGQAMRCRAPSPDQRPVCVIAVQMDKVAFEDAGGAVLSEWGGA